MKKSSLALTFIVLLIAFLGCTNQDHSEKKHPQITNPQLLAVPKSEKITNPQPGKRYITNNGTERSFSITGETVTATKVIGVQHNQNSPEVQQEFVIPYDAFWTEFFKDPAKLDSAGKMILAAEIDLDMFTGPKKMVIGQVISVTKPQFFVSQFIFSAGVRRLAICDQRPHNDRFWNIMTKADDLFSQRGGRMKTEGVDEDGFPKVVLVERPVLTPSDRLFLRKQWYEEVYLQDQAFEQKVFDLTKKGAIGVVGAGHAYKIFQRHGVPVALIASEQNIHLAVMRVKIHELYLEELGLN